MESFTVLRFHECLAALRRPLFAAALAIVVLSAAFAGSATASTATLGTSKIIYYTAAVGETNTLEISVIGSNIVLVDSTATITSETGPCTIGPSTTLTCPVIQSRALTVHLNDGNDQLTNNTATYGGNLYGGTGHDAITGGAEDEVLWGDDGSDQLSAGGGNDTIVAGAGDDLIDGGEGSDYLWGQSGSDWLTYESRTNPVYVSTEPTQGPIGELDEFDTLADDGIENVRGGSGDDTLIAQANTEMGWSILIGNDGDDALSVNPGGDGAHAIGGSGNDEISGGQRASILWGGSGDDELTGGAGDDSMEGDEGEDHLLGDDGQDMLWGDAGDDVLDAGADHDWVEGQDGNDLVINGPGDDSFFGGAGQDELSYEESTDGLVVDLHPALTLLVLNRTSFEHDRLKDSFEKLVLGSGNDTVLANDGQFTTIDCGGGWDWVRVDYEEPTTACEIRG